MIKSMACGELAVLMASDDLYAVFDVRERGEFNNCQIANATSLPRSQIEFRVDALAPNRAIPIVVYDDGGERAPLAARTLSALGYASVAVLEGGLPAWQKSGYPTASGVNVPSKAFGERVYHEKDVPDVTPQELKSLAESAADLAIFDVRTPEEFARFCIPGAVNVPGGDLIHWAGVLKEKPSTSVIINCAGRTRSIIGAAALRRLGLSNVRSLRNGTMGWLLAGYALERQPARLPPAAPEPSRSEAHETALRLAERERIPWVAPAELAGARQGSDAGVIYIIDVRSESEYERGHIAGSLSVPGGQAVQRADDFVAVHNARIIFVSEHGTRAVMAAYWYREMGFPDVSVLRGGLRGWTESGQPLAVGPSPTEPVGFAAARASAQLLGAEQLHRRMNENPWRLFDVGASSDFETCRVPGARWISRGWIDLKLPERFPDREMPVVLTCPDGRHSMLAAQALREIGYRAVYVLDGGVRAWAAAGFPTERGPGSCLTETNDVVVSPSIKGDEAEMRRYLEWELNLKH